MPTPTEQDARRVPEFPLLNHKHPDPWLDTLQVGNILQHRERLPPNDLTESGYGNSLAQVQVLNPSLFTPETPLVQKALEEVLPGNQVRPLGTFTTTTRKGFFLLQDPSAWWPPSGSAAEPRPRQPERRSAS